MASPRALIATPKRERAVMLGEMSTKTGLGLQPQVHLPQTHTFKTNSLGSTQADTKTQRQTDGQTERQMGHKELQRKNNKYFKYPFV